MTIPNSQWLTRLKDIECPDATYPAKDPALVFSRARGSIIWDTENRAFIDLCAGFGSLPVGHNDPEIIAKVFAEFAGERPAIMHGMGDVYASDAKVLLLEKLRYLLPSTLSMGCLALSGSHAVEIALKSAMLATKRSSFLAFQGSYHGVDLGVLPVTNRRDFSEPFAGWLPQKVSFLAFGCDETTVRAEFLRRRGEIAGVIVEPIQGRAGVILPPSNWLAMLRRICDEFDAVLIYDEVFVGLGRTGRWSFAEAVPADLICLGKTLGGGMPLSACFGTEKIMRAWPASRGEALHTGTFFGHPWSCRFGFETLEALEARGLLERSHDLGRQLKSRLDSALGSIATVRGEGLMLGIDGVNDGWGAVMMDRLRERGVIALASGSRGHCLSITPALNIPEAQLNTAFDAICAAALA